MWRCIGVVRISVARLCEALTLVCGALDCGVEERRPEVGLQNFWRWEFWEALTNLKGPDLR